MAIPRGMVNGEELPEFCAFSGCQRHAQYSHRGYCGAHYQRLRRAGELPRLKAPRGRHTPKFCSVCGAEILNGKGGWGMCTHHYLKTKRFGDPLAKGRVQMPEDEIKQKMINSYVGGDTCQTIANVFGFKKPTVRLWLRKWGVATRPSGFRPGGISPNRKDRKVDDFGYVMVRVTHHPNSRNGFILEHRLIMEKVLGRYLNSDEVVHHINNDPSDNRPENLLVMTVGEHSKMHRNRLGSVPSAGRSKSVELECLSCGNSFVKTVTCLCRKCRGNAAGWLTLASDTEAGIRGHGSQDRPFPSLDH